MARAKTNAKLAALKTLFKNHTDVYLRGYAEPNRESYSDAFCFEVIGKRTEEGLEVKSSIEIGGIVRNGHTSEMDASATRYDYEKHYRPVKGTWSLCNMDVLRSIVNSIPVDCEPRFEVKLDSGTTPACAKVGLHVDKLYIHAYNEATSEFERTFLIDTQTTPHNTARFGAPVSETDSGFRT